MLWETRLSLTLGRNKSLLVYGIQYTPPALRSHGHSSSQEHRSPCSLFPHLCAEAVFLQASKNRSAVYLGGSRGMASAVPRGYLLAKSGRLGGSYSIEQCTKSGFFQSSENSLGSGSFSSIIMMNPKIPPKCGCQSRSPP